MSFLSFAFVLQGWRELADKMGEAGDRLDVELEARMGRLALEIAGQAAKHIVGSRATNPPYLLGVKSGDYRRHLTGFARRRGPGIIEGIITPQGLRYPIVHEFGSAAIGHPEMNIPARPVLGPALKEKEHRILEELGGAFKAVLGR
jgi:hypothetical protein